MNPIIIVVVLFILSLLVLGGGVMFYIVRRARETSSRPGQPTPPPPVAPPKPVPVVPAHPTTTAAGTSTVSFRWRYILWPLIILALSVVATAVFYNLLPVQVGWRFAADGSADAFAARGTLVAILLVPQFVLTFGAAIVAFVISRVGTLMRAGPTPANAGAIIGLMGNMLALPQLILFFAMMDIFSYNAYQIHLLKLWVFALLAMLVGGVVLGVFFVRAVRQVRPSK